MLEIGVTDTLREIPPAEWDACFEGQAEGHAYLRAVERAAIPGFRLFYVTVREHGRLLAAAPGFLTDYRLATTLEGRARRFAAALERLAPRAMRLRLACLGSPVTETAGIGIAAGPRARRDELVAALLTGLDRKARAEGVRLQAVKDLPARQTGAEVAVKACGLTAMASLPTAILDLRQVPDEAAYWAKLSAATRKDLRRKLRRAAEVHVERVRDLTPWAAAVDALYAATRARAAMSFETRSWRYFQAVLEEMGEDAACFLYRVGDELIGFSLLVEGAGVVIDKYFCAGPRGREFNLYVLSWLQTVRYALSRRAARLVAGQACYQPKLRLGCRLEPTTILFRHRFAPVNAVLRLASRTLGAIEQPGRAEATSDAPPRPRAVGSPTAA
jgi:predicted N-acyltransferase